jgi:predicted site-specific integrase-resolvase
MCEQEQELVPIHRAAGLAGVSRATIYHWMRKGWIHWIERPSGRRLICIGSLSRQPGSLRETA